MEETASLINVKTTNKLCEPCKKKWEEHHDGQVLAKLQCIECKLDMCESCSVNHVCEELKRDLKVSGIEVTLNEDETENAILSNETKAGNPRASLNSAFQDLESFTTFDKIGTKENSEHGETLSNDLPPEIFPNDSCETAAICSGGCDENNATNSAESSKTNENLERQSEDAFNKKDEEFLKFLTDQIDENATLPLQELSSPDSTSVTYQNQERKTQSLDALLEDKFLDCLKDKEYSKLSPIITKPAVEEKELQTFWESVSPFLIQRIKMWNGNVISPQNIKSFFGRKRTRKKVDQTTTTSGSVSRIDFLTLIFNSADPIVTQDILVKLSKFHMTAPLFVQDLRDRGHFIITLPIMQNILIKSEPNPGEIIDNHLFSTNFRLIVAVRIGNSKVGKSTILNQMMRKSNVFSSCTEPGNWVGKPLSLDGMVELIWLTQETTNDSIWNPVLEEHYKSNSSEVVLLANLHGDAMQYVETIEFLATLSSSVIIFQMPDCFDEKLFHLKELISGKAETALVLVNQNNNNSEAYEISTDRLQTDDTMETLSCLLEDCLTAKAKDVSPDFTQVNCLGTTLRYSGTTKSECADEIVRFVLENGCLNTKQLMKDIIDVKYDSWSQKMSSLFDMSMTIFCFETKTSLAYLETQLSKISGEESLSAQFEVRSANERLRRIIVNVPRRTTDESDLLDHLHEENVKREEELKIAREELRFALKKVDDRNIGQEHFFRMLGQIYTKSMTDPELQNFQDIHYLPSRLAELLINGHAIEILNGDSGDIQSIWIQSIFKNVEKIRPNLKVFVISIVGLQSSGKSTLLNALFSCRFAVSVGRCSRGLFMRMIFLDDQLCQSHGFDCILLIDTEGLCSPEKMNDDRASHKDRLMATFAMGISNLTIVNILGEGMTEMTEILQIAIIAMARLRSGGIRPDILMVQHLQERNVGKIEQAKGQFCDAINKAFELISKNDVEIGSASAECLTELVDRIHSGDLFKHFGAFKDGSSVNSPPSEIYHKDVVSLYELLLEKAKNCKTRSMFDHWSHHFENYWNCAKEENFALNFKNVKHITDFLYFGKMMAKVKEELDGVIRFHRDIIFRKVKEIVASLLEMKKESITDEIRKKILAAITKKIELLPYTCVGNSFHWNVDLQCEVGSECLVEIDCEACKKFKRSYDRLLEAVFGTEWEQDIKTSLKDHRERLIQVTQNMLKDTFDASIVRQGYFSECSGLISSELEKSLKKRPHGKYSDEEIKSIVETIWSLLRKTTSLKQTDFEMKEEIFQAVVEEYAGTKIPELFKTEITLDFLRSSSDFKCSSGILKKFANKLKNLIFSDGETDPMVILIYELDQLFIRILHSDTSLPKSLNFSLGKVRQIKVEYSSLIKAYERYYNVKLGQRFKENVEVYTLQQIRNKLSASNEIHQRIRHALNREYVQTGILADILDRFKNQETIETLQGFKAVKSDKSKLSEKCMTELLDSLQNLIQRLFKSRDNNWQVAGLNFEDGMISEVKNSFSKEIKSFEKKFEVVLNDTFKIHLLIYTLQQLRDRMIDLQTIWNRENKPSEILEQKRDDYRREIEIRLNYGFSGAGEGIIAAMKLGKSIKAMAVQEVKSLKVRTVKDAPWTLNAENVRLHYFEKLAEEIKRGDKERALKHFRNPKDSIEKWFKEEIDSMHVNEKVMEKYLKTFETELESVIRKINRCSTKLDIDEVINYYIKGDDDQYFTKLSDMKIDAETFKNSLIRNLEEYLNSEEGKTANIPSVSNDLEIIVRLGCTAHCYFCGALCWGSRDHQSANETGIQIERHHTCHQPSGLYGGHHRTTEKLSAELCHLWGDHYVYYHEGSPNSILWKEAKEKHFSNWRFERHAIKEFDQLMRWFFQELHEDIARERNKGQVESAELTKHGCTGLNLENCLAVVKSKLRP